MWKMPHWVRPKTATDVQETLQFSNKSEKLVTKEGSKNFIESRVIKRAMHIAMKLARTLLLQFREKV